MTKMERTHHFSQTTCMHLGGPCPALAKMLQALTTALDKARPVTTEDFEICGESVLDGCPRSCPARFFATHDRIRVFCDVTKTAERGKLDLFADMLLDPTSAAQPASGIQERPCALGEVRPKQTPSRVAPLSYAAML